MRQSILRVIGLLLVASLATSLASAQGSRRQIRLPVPAQQTFTGVAGLNNSFAGPFFTPPASMVRWTSGTFNPSTGAFAPSPVGPYILSTRRGFEPVSGTFTPDVSGNFVLKTREAFVPSTGAFVPSTTGNFVIRQRGDFVPASGSFAQTATGTFNPATGAFAPSSSGKFTLSSGGVFVPGQGTFVPTPLGSFVLSAKEAFDPRTGMFVPSSTGTFTSMTRGVFVPSNGLVSATGFPVGTTGVSAAINPFGSFTLASALNSANPLGISPQAALRLATYYNTTPANALTASGFNPVGVANPSVAAFYNPYQSPFAFSNPYVSSFGVANPYLNPFTYANPIAYSSPSAYANPHTSYSSGAYAPAPYAAPYASYGSAAVAGYAAAQPYGGAPAYSPSGAQAMPQSVLAALGVPNDNGAVDWPLALRLMPAEQKRELLEPLEAQLQIAGKQATEGTANPVVVREARDHVESVGRWLRAHRSDMADGSYRDAEGFLSKLDKTLKTLASGH